MKRFDLNLFWQLYADQQIPQGITLAEAVEIFIWGCEQDVLRESLESNEDYLQRLIQAKAKKKTKILSHGTG